MYIDTVVVKSFISGLVVQWLGRVIRGNDSSTVKETMIWKPTEKSPRERLRKR